MTRLAPLALLVVGCGGPGTDQPPATDEPTDAPDTPSALPEYTPLAPLDLLARASLDLRGVRPSVAEVDAVLADPSSVDAVIDGFVDDPRFGSRVGAMYDEVFQIRDELPFVDLSYFLGEHSIETLSKSIGEEPSRVLAHIADQDLSYREMVTGDWTMADELLATMWPVDYPQGERGWHRVHYTDGRPHAGVLAGNGLWWHHGSMLNNLNRGRANHFSRIFLCFDYLDLEIDFSGIQALNSEEALGEAIRTDDNCAVCHDTLDPLAAHFFGFWYFSARKRAPYDIGWYHPEREQAWADLDGLAPAFMGEPTSGLEDLAHRTADDARYSRCFVKRSWEGMLRREPLSEEAELIDGLDQSFRDTDLRIRELFRALIHTDAYRNGEGALGPKLASPALLSSQIAELTAFEWTEDDWDLLRAPVRGYGPLAGGIDGIFRTDRLSEPSATFLLVHKRVAESAARWVVGRDFTQDDPSLLVHRPGSAHPDTDDALFRTQLAHLHKRILTEDVPADDLRIDAEIALWRDVFDISGNPREAWSAVVSLLLRDPRLVVY